MLTTEEQNLVKDILKAIGQDDVLNAQMAEACGYTEGKFDLIAENIFRKLGNRRLIVKDNDAPWKLYRNAECPDCGTGIGKNVKFEESCENCGHVFNVPKEND